MTELMIRENQKWKRLKSQVFKSQFIIPGTGSEASCKNIRMSRKGTGSVYKNYWNSIEY